MASQNTTFMKLLKKHTSIDKDFINEFFKDFKIGEELSFHIEDKKAAEYLGIKVESLRNRLLNKGAKTKAYLEHVDYIKTKRNGASNITYFINYQCFERLAMSGNSEESETIRSYFTKLREFILENQKIIYQAMTNKDDLRKYAGYKCIYFFAADERKEHTFKIGGMNDIIRRLQNYNIGQINDANFKYLAIVKNKKIIDGCIANKLKPKQLHENMQIFQININGLKKVIQECYAEHVTKKENNALYDELSQLAGLYAYARDKKIVKTYIVIGK